MIAAASYDAFGDFFVKVMYSTFIPLFSSRVSSVGRRITTVMFTTGHGLPIASGQQWDSGAKEII